MVLWMIGLGLGDADDITVKGQKAIDSSVEIYLEAYTSLLPGLGAEDLEKRYCSKNQQKIIAVHRKEVEDDDWCAQILKTAETQNVSFLVAGDPLCATTHSSLMLEAMDRKVEVQVVHNASIMNAVACCGLQLYRFGQTISIPADAEDTHFSFYDKLLVNYKAGMHTLCLLDIKVKEQTLEMMMTGRESYRANLFMTVQEGVKKLMAIEKAKEQMHGTESIISLASAQAVGIARLGSTDQKVVFGQCSELAAADDEVFGQPLHSLVICAPQLDEIETKVLSKYKSNLAALPAEGAATDRKSVV